MTVITGLKALPKRYDGHVWADYIELLCITDQDGELTQAEIEFQLAKRKDVGEEYAEPDTDFDGEPDESPEDAARARLAEDEGNGAEEAEDFGSDEGLRDDRRGERVADIFKHLEYRAEVLGDAYPFELSPDGSTIALVDNMLPARRLYLFLLLCANLRYVAKRRSPPLPRAFERLSVRAMRRLVPADAEVHLFGKGEPGERYAGSLWVKIQTLAKDLCAEVTGKERDFPPRNTGDNGLDIVAWANHHDDQPARLLIFGQCACTEEWVRKQRSSGPEVWASTIRMLAMPSNVVFIPHMFRDAQGLWHREADIHHSVLIDRFRLLRMLASAGDLDVPENAAGHVDELLALGEAA